jgi:hypothetical protein
MHAAHLLPGAVELLGFQAGCVYLPAGHRGIGGEDNPIVPFPFPATLEARRKTQGSIALEEVWTSFDILGEDHLYGFLPGHKTGGVSLYNFLR